MSNKTKAIEFLSRYGMYHGDIDIDRTCGVFLEKMANGLANQPSSLAMIPTYIEADRDLPVNQNVIVIDAGGTHFRCAVCRFDENNQAAIDNFSKHAMPGVASKVSKDEFFNTMADYVQPVADQSSAIGFCFSYPCEIFPDKDGRLIYFSKEIKADEVIGEKIGENLLAALKAKGTAGGKRIVILNDTVTTLLAGKAAATDQTFDAYIGFILGTGTNCCYVEQNRNILKKPGLDPAKSQVINIESGGFAEVPRGQIDIAFDNTTKNPGKYAFEKTVSGAYLGALCLAVLKKAAADGLFQTDTATAIEQRDSLDTKIVSDFLTDPDNNDLAAQLGGVSDDDKQCIFALLENMVTRAGKLSAINLASVAIKTEKGADANRPICIVAEGTTFYHLNGLKAATEKFLDEYLTGQKGIHYRIVSVENATLIGAAIAGLTN